MLLLYRGGVVSSFFITVRSLSYSYRTPSREVLASLRGRRDGRHMRGSEGEAEQSETRPAEAEPCFPANSPRPSSPRGTLLRRSGTRASGLRHCGISLLAPAEFGTVHPHAMHDHDVLDNMANFGAVRMALTSPVQPGRRSGRYQRPPRCA